MNNTRTYKHTHTHTHIYIYIYIYDLRRRIWEPVCEKKREMERVREGKSICELFCVCTHTQTHTHTHTRVHAYTHTRTLVCPQDMIVNGLDCGLEVSELELQSHYYVHFRINTIRKGMNPLFPLYVLNMFFYKTDYIYIYIYMRERENFQGHIISLR